MINKNTIPEHWERRKIGEILNFVGGGTPDKSNKSYWGGQIPWASVKDIKDKYLNRTQDKITETGLENSSAQLAKSGDLILISRISPGKVSIAKIDTAINQDLKVVKPKVEIDTLYVYYLFQTIEKEIIKNSSATTVLGIRLDKLKEIEIPVPPYSEQKEIVAKIEELLSELDKGKEQLETARQQLKVYRQAVLKWAFEGKLTNSEVKEGELPEGWKWVKIEDIASVGAGATPLKNNKAFYENGKVAWVTSGALNDEFVKEATDFVTEKALKETNLKIYPKHTLLLAMYGEGKTRGKCSELLIEASTNQAIAAIYFEKHDINVKPFLKYFLLKNYNDIRRMSSGGVQPNLNLGIVKKTLVPLPQIEEQKQIVQEIESRLSVCDKVEETITQSLQQAETLRQSILKKAFEGKLIKQKAEVTKPKNIYFYQVQLLAYLIHYSNLKGINHGEMTAAKYAYLLHKIYGINTYYNFKRWHLGPYAPEMKAAIKKKEFFAVKNNRLTLVNPANILKYGNPIKEQVVKAIGELSQLIESLPGKNRAHKTELFATVCKVIEDIQSTDLQEVRASMAEWKIELATTHYKSKAEKFNEQETEEYLAVLIEKGWDKKLINS
ncbi:MAG: restriction endonuclease subunit S [Adhaeribacter sp.]